jgi:hypothetical protein
MLLYAPKQTAFIVVSAGGVATTFLLDFFGERGIRCNDSHDRDTLKHCPRPPITLNRRLKVVYVVGDPVVAVGSLFRRGYQHEAFSKFTRFSGAKPCAKALSDLRTYAETKQDLLMLERHFLNWTNRFQVYSTFVVKYDDIWTCFPDMLDFLGLPPQFSCELSEKRSRESTLPREISDLLEQTYSTLRGRVNSLEGFTVLPFHRWRYGVYFVRTLPLLVWGCLQAVGAKIARRVSGLLLFRKGCHK